VGDANGIYFFIPRENGPDLALEEWNCLLFFYGTSCSGIDIKKILENLILRQGIHNPNHVFRAYLWIECPLWFDEYRRFHLAEPVAAGNAEMNFIHPFSVQELSLCDSNKIVGTACLATRPCRYHDGRDIGISIDHQPFLQLLEFID
jgi:hypothetical protein